MSSDPSASRDRSSRVSSPFSPRSLVAVIKILAVHNRCLSPYNNEKLQSRESSLARKLSRTLYTHSQRKYNISVYLPIYPQTINLGRRGRQDRGDETAVSSWTLAAAGAAAAYFRPSTARRDSSALRVSFSSASSSSSSSSFSIAPSLSLSLSSPLYVRATSPPGLYSRSGRGRARARETSSLSLFLLLSSFLSLSLSPLPFLPLPRRRRSRRRRSHRQRRRARAPSFSLSLSLARTRVLSPPAPARATCIRSIRGRATRSVSFPLPLFLQVSCCCCCSAPLWSPPPARARAPLYTAHPAAAACRERNSFVVVGVVRQWWGRCLAVCVSASSSLCTHTSPLLISRLPICSPLSSRWYHHPLSSPLTAIFLNPASAITHVVRAPARFISVLYIGIMLSVSLTCYVASARVMYIERARVWRRRVS